MTKKFLLDNQIIGIFFRAVSVMLPHSILLSLFRNEIFYLTQFYCYNRVFPSTINDKRGKFQLFKLLSIQSLQWLTSKTLLDCLHSEMWFVETIKFYRLKVPSETQKNFSKMWVRFFNDWDALILMNEATVFMFMVYKTVATSPVNSTFRILQK